MYIYTHTKKKYIHLTKEVLLLFLIDILTYFYWNRRVSPLVPVKGTLNASAYQDNLDNFMLPTLWEQFGDDPFLFQHDCTPVHKTSVVVYRCPLFCLVVVTGTVRGVP
ncbi:hypothetical protein QTP86_010694 [Hemibagrus guttatus]|nr:hypothetical protein QTP86_010694 [Hemibagrus guttatus]